MLMERKTIDVCIAPIPVNVVRYHKTVMKTRPCYNTDNNYYYDHNYLRFIPARCYNTDRSSSYKIRSITVLLKRTVQEMF